MSELSLEALNLKEFLTAMPNEWILELRKAALDADFELVHQIIEQVSEIYTLEIKVIKHWVNNFMFENVLDLTESFGV